MRLDVGGYALAVRIHAAPEAARTALLLHGLAGTGADWDEALPAFSADTTAVTLDLIGHGESDAPEDPAMYSAEAVSDALVEATKALRLQAPVWVGYSLGARVLLSLALRHPARVGGLVLVSAHPGIADAAARAERARQDAADAALLEARGLNAWLDAWHDRPAFDTRRGRPGWGSEVARKRATNRPHALARCLRGLGLGAQPPLLGQVHAVRAPALLLAGTLDPPYLAWARAIAQRMPSARFRPVEGAGHAVHRERPDAFRAEVRAFLEATS